MGRADQRDASRALLLDVARDLFARHGYDRTSVAMVSEAAGVTHGALYHHFGSKSVLFDEVLRAVASSVAERIAEHARALSGWDRLVGALDTFLDQYAEPDVMAIMLNDGPRVLGRERFAEIDRIANDSLLAGLLRTAMDEGVLAERDVTVTALVLTGALEHAASVVADAEPARRPRVRAEVRALLLAWIGALRVPDARR
ncbi:TetR/AcrR family transcriptional regulator [Nocardia sp. NPDC050697]|uniref:TetR/AcrR family transcriptional regulator n=1 Tax=Nocardia sp. NPDC050697 TaxID=3155158 RepID=UPI0033D3F2F2